jgi:hypothetical protein
MEVSPAILGTRRMEVFDGELCGIGHGINKVMEKKETLLNHGVMMVAVFSDLQAAIGRATHLGPVPGLRRARMINRRGGSPLAQCIATEINWDSGCSGIPGTEESDCHPKVAHEVM